MADILALISAIPSLLIVLGHGSMLAKAFPRREEA
jgi:hypothetical protein